MGENARMNNAVHLSRILRSALTVTLMTFATVFGASAQNLSAEDPSSIPGIGNYPLELSARMTQESAPISRGMVWRVFREREDADGKLPLLATAKGGTAKFELPAGTYLVHAAFGRAGATKRVSLGSDGSSEEIVLQAGGLELNATAAESEIAPRNLRFSVFELELDDEGERKLISRNVKPGKVIRLNAGTYHVLSRYGNINATVRADLEVKAGEITRAVLQHRGAPISLRLVSQSGGDPIANTAWTVLTEDGEEVFSSNSVAPSLVLAEGGYEATVRNGEKTYRQPFNVRPGQRQRVELLLAQ